MYSFEPNFEIIKIFPGQASIEQLEREQGVYSATPEFVIKHCGPLAKKLLNTVPQEYYQEAKRLGLYPNIDIRIHRLYRGDYPAYPGWHCDGEYRETYFSQPDLDKIKVSKHLIATISSHPEGVSNCQFLSERFEYEPKQVDSEHTLWGQVHSKLEQKPNKKVFDSQDGQLILFDSWSLHRVMPARIRGWRLFFRMSMWHRKNLGNGGMLTKQEQVYKLVEGSGW